MDFFASHNLIASIFSEPETDSEGLPSTSVDTDGGPGGGGVNGYCTIS
jgi:hypothetical protein